MAPTGELLRFRGVDKTIGRVKALSGFDLAVAPGEFVALVGPPGSGKAAVLRLASGLDKPDHGSIAFAGRPFRPAALLSIGIASPDIRLDPARSLAANLRYSASLFGLTRSAARARIDALLHRFALHDHEHDLVGSLAGGASRRAELARAVLHAPDILLLGDIAEGLTAADAAQLLEDAGKLQAEEGMAVLWATSNAGEGEKADRIVVLRRGSAVFAGTPAELKSQHGSGSLAAAIARLTGVQDGR